jgi:hypothetical protein
VPLGTSLNLPSQFTIDDNYYQAYLRYAFKGLQTRGFSAYLRVGFSYVDAKLEDTSVIPALGLYNQSDKTTDLLGNLGFGVGYSIYKTRRTDLKLQLEGEGFYGKRSQDSLETLPKAGSFPFTTVHIDNDLYGGIGRATVHFEYKLGKTGLFRTFAEGGFEGKFTEIKYSGLGNFSELLYGPYGKIGLSYSF